LGMWGYKPEKQVNKVMRLFSFLPVQRMQVTQESSLAMQVSNWVKQVRMMEMLGRTAAMLGNIEVRRVNKLEK
jgi:hypothetical protein